MPALPLSVRRDAHVANVARWPSQWPELSALQRSLMRRLRSQMPTAFVAAMDAAGCCRVVLLSRSYSGRLRAREWVLLRDGRMVGVSPGVPYQKAA